MLALSPLFDFLPDTLDGDASPSALLALGGQVAEVEEAIATLRRRVARGQRLGLQIDLSGTAEDIGRFRDRLRETIVHLPQTFERFNATPEERARVAAALDYIDTSSAALASWVAKEQSIPTANADGVDEAFEAHKAALEAELPILPVSRDDLSIMDDGGDQIDIVLRVRTTHLVEGKALADALVRAWQRLADVRCPVAFVISFADADPDRTA